MSHRLLLLLSLAGLAMIHAGAAEQPKPNVVFIMADDLGYGDLGPYGATKISTPHCDRLAREGRRFTDAHTPSGVCSPTRFGLLTGGYPWRENRVPRHLHASEPLVIRDGEPTVASLLKSAGYATGCVGKWHLGAQRQNPIDWDRPLAPGPNAAGFDYYFGVINSHNQAPFVLVENERILGLTPADRIAVEGNVKQTSGPHLRDENALESARMGGSSGHQPVGVLRGEKATAWEGGHRVPFILRWPGKVPAGTESGETICHVDFMATICAALGLALPAHAGPDSWNVLPAWLGEKMGKPLREATVCVSQVPHVFSIRQGPWKLLLDNKKGAASEPIAAEPQLFNLAHDLSEKDNLAAAQPEKVNELAALLAKYRAQGFSRPGWQRAVK